MFDEVGAFYTSLLAKFHFRGLEKRDVFCLVFIKCEFSSLLGP